VEATTTERSGSGGHMDLKSGNDDSGDSVEEETKSDEAADVVAVSTITPSTPVEAGIKRSPDQQKLYSIHVQHVNPGFWIPVISGRNKEVIWEDSWKAYVKWICQETSPITSL
jgi:hypothetical protein